MKMSRARPNYGVYDPAAIIIFSALIGWEIYNIIFEESITWKVIWAILLIVFLFLLASILLDSRYFHKVAVRDRFVELAKPKDGDVVLDIGTGRGPIAIGFAKALKKGKVIGTDIWSQSSLSGNRIENAQENARIEGVTDKVEFKTADARKLPFRDEYFDIVTLGFTLHNIRRGKLKAIEEIVRVLKPNGKLLIAEVPIFWPRQRLRRALERYGISDLRSCAVGINEYIGYGIKYRKRM
jgi:SAM-dependent methyltransferase